MKTDRELRDLALTAGTEAQKHGLTANEARVVFLMAAAQLTAGVLKAGDGPDEHKERVNAAGAKFSLEYELAVQALGAVRGFPVHLSDANTCDTCGQPATLYVSVDQALDENSSEEANFCLCEAHGIELRELARQCARTTKSRDDEWLDGEAKIALWAEPDDGKAKEASEEYRTCEGCTERILEHFKVSE